MADSGQELRCVSCNVFKPANGKLLHCLHVICLECLKGSICHPGCVKCMLCNYLTAPRQIAVDLAKQLVNCCPSVYAPESTDDEGTANPNGLSGATSRLNCLFCIDVQRSAKYTCQECRNEPLCDIHGKRHAQFTGHSLDLRDVASVGISAELALSRACQLHPKNDVTRYCNTCNHSVCERCTASGHQNHSVEKLSSAAKTQRALIAKMLLGRSRKAQFAVVGPKSAAASISARTPIATKMYNITQDIDDVTAQAERASQVVTETSDKIGKVVEKKEKEILSEIDEKSWSLLQPMQASQQHLRALMQQESIAARLATLLCSSESDDIKVMELLPLVNRVFQRLEEAEAEKRCSPRCEIKVDGQTTLEHMEEYIKSFLPVICDQPLDVEAMEFVLPEHIIAMEPAVIMLKPSTPKLSSAVTSVSLDDVLCTLTPNGEECAVKVTRNDRQPAVDISCIPQTSGEHVLTVEVGGKTNTLSFHVKPAGVRWDVNKCSPYVCIVSNGAFLPYFKKHFDLRIDTGCVLAEIGFTSGRHQWTVILGGLPRDGTGCVGDSYNDTTKPYVAVGVCRKPTDGNYSGGSFPALSYHWRSHGNVIGNGTASIPWRYNSRMTFTLDCDNCTLQMRRAYVTELFRRMPEQEERCIIHDLDCSLPLYPAAYLNNPLHQVVIQ